MAPGKLLSRMMLGACARARGWQGRRASGREFGPADGANCDGPGRLDLDGGRLNGATVCGPSTVATVATVAPGLLRVRRRAPEAHEITGGPEGEGSCRRAQRSQVAAGGRTMAGGRVCDPDHGMPLSLSVGRVSAD